mmetsp:Transcript_9893/g.22227  ORF Transcript_9893/g.22227 Transcript_9893/m.22227 type:complete len:494 (-) Transcript_9893:304-1785(-)|eukprot:CAMPEP_0172300742 /NCGR_PEP_ID=MMETSP1058-20130122/2766_1 /TAXON_ID=83371 /ORGANISM="Detonula confervacea, Strain CCMP 353" /LENGTH=493 /DNA_ID=CAMNT_0013010619 /DNA_START=17 /DNA_END=1498 /DNA_ORIENTATION=-
MSTNETDNEGISKLKAFVKTLNVDKEIAVGDARDHGADAVTGDDNDTSSSIKKKFVVSEMPRWRFINKAKKTEGYSTEAAGEVVEGLTAEELAAGYNEPQWTLDRRLKRRMTLIGKLATEQSNEVEETFEGESAGGLKKKSNEDKQEGNGAQSSVSVPEEGELMNDELVSSGGEETVEGLALPTEMEPEIAIVAASPIAAIRDDDELDQVEKQAVKDPEEPRDAPFTPVCSLHSSEELISKVSIDGDDEPRQKKERCILCILILLLLLLIILMLGTILGYVWGSKSEEDSMAFAGGAGIVIDNNETYTPSQAPSSDLPLPTKLPSKYPTATSPPSLNYCPPDSKFFSIKHNNGGAKQKNENVWTIFHTTWVVKDVRSGEEVLSCLPCLNNDNGTSLFSNNDVTAFLFDNHEEEDPSVFDDEEGGEPRRILQKEDSMGVVQNYRANTDGVSGCLPNENDYVIEVKSLPNDAETCCGLDPDSRIVTFGIAMFGKR